MAATMTETHKAVVFKSGGKEDAPIFAIDEIPRPTPGSNEVLVRLSVTGLCGSDYGLALGHFGPTLNVFGHEGVGHITALGSNIASIDPAVEVGQRVGVAWTRDICGTCDFCLDLANEGETRCAKALFSGKAYDGTFAQYTLVPLRYLARIPSRFDDLSDEIIAPILCAGVTAYKAIKNCNIAPGQWVVISGAGGGVGVLGIAYARAMGYRVIAVDAGAAKRDQCITQGAEHYVDVTKENPGEQVNKFTEGKGGKAVVVTAAAAAAYQQAFEMLGPFGTLMCVGIIPPEATVGFNPILLIARGLKILGSAVGTRADILEALEFVKRGLVVPKVHSGKMEDVEGLIGRMAKGELQGKWVIKIDQ